MYKRQAVLFAVALFLSPIFLAIPGFATTPALVFVGLLMMSSVKKMTFDGDIADTVSYTHLDVYKRQNND